MNTELFLFWQTTDKHSSFNGLIQEDIDLSDIYLAVLGILAKLVWSILSFKNGSFEKYSAFGFSYFCVVRENLRGLRENLKHKKTNFSW